MNPTPERVEAALAEIYDRGGIAALDALDELMPWYIPRRWLNFMRAVITEHSTEANE